MSSSKFYRKKFRNTKSLPTELKIKNFVLRNSKNGFYTKITTISKKFELSDSRVWEIIGDLLEEGKIEAIHDQKTGEMKLCEVGKTFQILSLQQKRNQEKFRDLKKSKMSKEKKESKPTV